MGLLTTVRQRLSDLSSPQKATNTTSLPDTPPPRRRRIHRRRPSGAGACSSDLNGSPTPPFVRRDRHKRSASLSTPPEISESVSYAKTCSAYLCGQAMSVRQLATSYTQHDAAIPTTTEAFQQARENLHAEFEVFERDQVQWAGYLMEGSQADDDDPGRTRLFVQEGLEIMHAVDQARLEVDGVCAL